MLELVDQVIVHAATEASDEDVNKQIKHLSLYIGG